MRIRRFLSLILMTAMLLTMIPQVAQAHVIKNGDYIAFGTYNGEPIIWRVVGDVTGDNLRLISDKIISLKAFDGRHATGTDYQVDGGSGRWSNSNIRSWLNSTSTTVNFECANRPMNGNVTTNEYDAEAGFLSDFSVVERGYMKEVTNITALNAANVDADSDGSVELAYDRESETLSTNYESAYTEQSTEYIYLPSVEDIEYIQNNVYVFGADYHKALPTEEAVEQSFMKYEALRSDNDWYYWLRDAMYGNDDSLVRCVTPYNTVEYAAAYDGIIGVRPMCTLDTDLIGIVSGNGSDVSPYMLFNEPWIALEGNAENVVSGSDVVMSLYKSNIGSDMDIEVYHNGELIATNPEAKFNITAISGVNSVEAKVTDSERNIIASASFDFHGLELKQTDELRINDTFDDPTTLSNYFVSEDDSPYTTFTYLTENGDGMLLIDSTQGTTAALATHGKKFDEDYTSVMVEADFKFASFGDYNTSLLPICVYSNGVRTWWSPLHIAPNGIFSIRDVEIGKTQIGNIDLNVWYNIKLIIDNDTDTITIILTDEREPDTQEIICSNVKASIPIDYVTYINVSLCGKLDAHQTMYLSTLKAGGYELVDNEKMLGNIYVENDNKTVCVFVANTTGAVLEADLVVAIYNEDYSLKDVKIVATDINIDRGMTYDVPFDEAIVATDKVKAFLLDEMSNIMPLSPSVELKR